MSCCVISSRVMPRVCAAEYRYRPWPASSCTLAIRIALRLRLGARVIQLPSGCIPMISECACCEIWRISVLRYASGIQSRGSMRESAAMSSSKRSCSETSVAECGHLRLRCCFTERSFRYYCRHGTPDESDDGARPRLGGPRHGRRARRTRPRGGLDARARRHDERLPHHPRRARLRARRHRVRDRVQRGRAHHGRPGRRHHVPEVDDRPGRPSPRRPCGVRAAAASGLYDVTVTDETGEVVAEVRGRSLTTDRTLAAIAG